MRAITYTRFGDSDVLGLAEVEDLHPGAGEVRLKVVTAGVNPIDYRIRRGWMQDMFPVSFPVTPGTEAAGIVDEVGDGVTGFMVGDEVMGWMSTGAYAQYAVSSNLAHKPAALSWDLAAALPVAVETADRVVNLLDVTAGEVLVVNGAAGVVGATAVQLAVARGVHVIGTASPANHDYLRSLGVIPVTYGDGVENRIRAELPGQVAAVLDATGHDFLETAIALRDGSTTRIVTIADPRAVELGVQLSGGTRQFSSDLARYAQLAVEGSLSVRIAQTFSLGEAHNAQDISEAGHAHGKLVLHVQ